MDNSTEVQTFKIVIIGDSYTGKTSLAYRLCTGKFYEKLETTIGVDFFEKTIKIDDEQVRVRDEFLAIVIVIDWLHSNIYSHSSIADTLLIISIFAVDGHQICLIHVVIYCGYPQLVYQAIFLSQL
jgi:GTPase SAR1 family protein